MDLVLKTLSQLNAAIGPAILFAAFLTGIALLLVVMMARRAWQHHRIRRFDQLSFTTHERWRKMVRGEISAEAWWNDPLQREILQSIVIQEISAATDKDRTGLQAFLRQNGFLDRCILRVHTGHGWDRRRAMLALGAMRVPEAVAPLAEALDDWQLDNRLDAVRALGLTGLAEAAEPILEAYMVGGLKVPADPLVNTLVRCYQDQPEALLPYLRRSLGKSRELLARVAGELATAEMADEMLVLADDGEAEVRASAAKALAVAPLALAIPALGKLVHDEFWFVRLRAVTALNQIPHPRVIPILIDALCDSNRLVRVRAATALSKFEGETVDILQRVVESRDQYALHAMISALELAGGFGHVLAQLSDPAQHDDAAARLLEALRKGSEAVWSTRPADPVIESVFP
jgi:HEAT repeat protein